MRLTANSMGHLNVSARNLDDAIVVLDIDQLTSGAEVNARVLSMPGFSDKNGDGHLHVAGITGEDDEDGGIRLWAVNSRPSVDPATGDLLDNKKIGANTTIELFRTGRAAEKLEHIKTFAHPQIVNPNRIAAVGGKTDAFYFTNDHGTAKVGLVSHPDRF
jgi:arylesterase / paraoxonase